MITLLLHSVLVQLSLFNSMVKASFHTAYVCLITATYTKRAFLWLPRRRTRGSRQPSVSLQYVRGNRTWPEEDINVMLLGSHHLQLILNKRKGNSQAEVIHFSICWLSAWCWAGCCLSTWVVCADWGTVLEPCGNASICPVDGAQVTLSDHLILEEECFLLSSIVEPWHFFLSAI